MFLTPQLFTNAPAQTAIISSATQIGSIALPCDLLQCVYGSFHLVWAALTTGTSINATLSVDTSNDGVHWAPKTGSSLVVTTANGNDFISFNGGILTSRYIRANWDAGGITSGTINLFTCFKG